jgi:hypothetical protein
MYCVFSVGEVLPLEIANRHDKDSLRHGAFFSQKTLYFTKPNNLKFEKTSELQWLHELVKFFTNKTCQFSKKSSKHPRPISIFPNA